MDEQFANILLELESEDAELNGEIILENILI